MKKIFFIFLILSVNPVLAERPVAILPSNHPTAIVDSQKANPNFRVVRKETDTSEQDFTNQMKFMCLIKKNQKIIK